ncbi:2Fe-2S iron-sulfur cluster-binding protein [Wenzhouxiangella sp. EGI_FJ10305]|uniref:2Fe-2S iron-sulfur cluster-binding protein n=1 Tax=Wenzhouxiangella sp. EGI_FJ10305 TaxID=3243768 RepID=UPI0035D7FCDD
MPDDSGVAGDDMQVRYQQQLVDVRDGETLLSALLRQGLPVRYSCRAGTCHTCLMRATSGRPPEAAGRGLGPELIERGFFLPCKCRPTGPLEVEQPSVSKLATGCQVMEAKMLAPDIRCLRLRSHPGIDPKPGQHVRVLHPEGATRCYSVASLPQRDGYLELHVRRVEGGRVSRWLVDEVAVGDGIDLLPPSGDLINPEPKAGRDLLLVGTGTGLAPLAAILREALAEAHAGRIWLLHGVRGRPDLYADTWLRVLESAHPRLTYLPCCTAEPDWPECFHGRVTDLLAEQLTAAFEGRVLVAGRPDMVDAVASLCRERCESAEVRGDPFLFGHEAIPTASSGGERRVPPPDPELWSRLGNGELLREVLRDFYDIAFEDEHLGPYFHGVTRQRLREKQYSFLRSLMLGTRDYMGQRPRNAHHWMVIPDWLFDYRLELMEQCMRDHGLTEPWIGRWHALEAFFRRDIVKQAPWPRRIGENDVLLDGLEEAVLEDGGHCDGCERIIKRGESVSFHLREGSLYCGDCSRPSSNDGTRGLSA